MDYDEWGWRRYVPVAERRRKAAGAMQKRQKQGHAVSPVIIDGRVIAKTFWGKAWCENLERYSDYDNRLPRGRTYVRNGSVVDLRIAPGAIHAYVSGSELYKVTVKVASVTKARWESICKDCAGAIDSLVELLQGRLSSGVMERICRQNHGLFPSPAEIQLSCSCPDWADMCKHVAAVLYGIGARFDQQPELLFRLRAVNELELIGNASRAAPLAKQASVAAKLLDDQDLSGMFGLDMAPSARSGAGLARKPAAKPKRAGKTAAASKAKRKPRKQAAASTQSRKRARGRQMSQRPPKSNPPADL